MFHYQLLKIYTSIFKTEYFNSLNLSMLSSKELTNLTIRRLVLSKNFLHIARKTGIFKMLSSFLSLYCIQSIVPQAIIFFIIALAKNQSCKVLCFITYLAFDSAIMFIDYCISSRNLVFIRQLISHFQLAQVGRDEIRLHVTLWLHLLVLLLGSPKNLKVSFRSNLKSRIRDRSYVNASKVYS